MLLCKGFAQGDKNTSKWASHAVFTLSYGVHIFPSGATVPVEMTAGLLKFCLVGMLTATSLASEWLL